MNTRIRNYRLRGSEDRWDPEVVARFEAVITIGEEPSTEDLILRNCELVQVSPTRYRVVAPITEEGEKAFSLPSFWEDALKEQAVERYQRARLFSPHAFTDDEELAGTA